MDNLDTTLFRLPVLGLLFSPTSSGRNFAAICVNDALINEIMLFGIISELISRITRSISLFHSTYLWKFTATFILDFRKETRSLVSDPRIRGSVHYIEQGFKRRKGFSFIHFFNPIWKVYGWDAVNFIVNQFINKLNLLHVEVYQNEISQGLPTVLFSAICCQSRVYHD